jgi:tetratricopeptide (TPR) repeat protein
VVGSEAGDPLDTVAHLVDVSLLDVVEGPDGEPVLSMLETIRRFARQRLLESGEHEEVHLRHARWGADVAAAIAETLRGPHQLKALDRISALEDDLRSALDWTLLPAPDSTAEQRECGYRLLVALGRYWYRFGYVAEGQGWSDRALPVLDAENAVSEPFVDALHNVAILMVQRGEYEGGVRLLDRALVGARVLGDLSREARECNSLGIARRELGDPAAARDHLERSLDLARALGSAQREVTALTNLTSVLMDTGDYTTAVDTVRQALEIDRALGDPWGIAINEFNLATALLHAEGPEAARDQLVRTAPDAVALEDAELSIQVLEAFSCVLAELGDAEVAARLLGTAEVHRERVGLPRSAPEEQSVRRFVETARAVRADQWAASYAAGRGLSIRQAVEDALASRFAAVRVTGR